MHRWVALAVLCGSLTAFAAEPSTEKPKLAVLDLSAGAGVEPSVATAMTSAVISELAAKGYFEVISSQEMQTLLGVQRQRQIMGCSSEQDSCVAELAGALGARFILTGSITRLGDAYQLALQTMDSRKAQPLGRSTKFASSLDSLRELLPFAVADATATEPPPTRSHLLSFGMITAGGLCALGAGIVVLQAFSLEAATQKELELGNAQRVVLKPAASYEDTASRIRLEKTIGVAAAGAAAVLIGLGVFLELRPLSSSASARAALVPTSNGFALVGSWE
jgi:TolB-like protein